MLLSQDGFCYWTWKLPFCPGLMTSELESTCLSPNIDTSTRSHAQLFCGCWGFQPRSSCFHSKLTYHWATPSSCFSFLRIFKFNFFVTFIIYIYVCLFSACIAGIWGIQTESFRYCGAGLASGFGMSEWGVENCIPIIWKSSKHFNHWPISPVPKFNLFILRQGGASSMGLELIESCLPVLLKCWNQGCVPLWGAIYWLSWQQCPFLRL